MKLGRKLTWDAKAERFVNDTEANALCGRKARKADYDIGLIMKKAGPDLSIQNSPTLRLPERMVGS